MQPSLLNPTEPWSATSHPRFSRGDPCSCEHTWRMVYVEKFTIRQMRQNAGDPPVSETVVGRCRNTVSGPRLARLTQLSRSKQVRGIAFCCPEYFMYHERKVSSLLCILRRDVRAFGPHRACKRTRTRHFAAASDRLCMFDPIDSRREPWPLLDPVNRRLLASCCILMQP